MILTVVAFMFSLTVLPAFPQPIDYCEGNFDYDDDQDGSDAFIFKTDFGRSTFGNPCPPNGPAPIPQTGQTFNFWGNDDGFYECGVTPHDQRFTSNCDGTFSDHLTGLTWIVPFQLHLSYTWIDAMLAISDYNTNQFAGHNDWRMPNIKELQSLIDYGQNQPALKPSLYTAWNGEPVWSSTTKSDDWHYKYVVDFHYGTTILENYESTHPVLPVRGGRCSDSQPKIECNSASNCEMGFNDCCCVFGFNDSRNYCHPYGETNSCESSGGVSDCAACSTPPRFTDNGDGTITDNNTGLIWLKDAFCNDLNGSSGHDWNDSISAVAGLASGSCNLTDGSVAGDWRLPLMLEWEAFICFQFPSSLRNVCNTEGDGEWEEGDPFINVWGAGSFYWTGTEYDSTRTWSISLYTGAFVTTDKIFSHYIWPVRNEKTPNRFTVNGNGTVTDNDSGLIWLKNADCFGWLNWYDASNAVSNLSSGQCNLTDSSISGDWRMPLQEEWEDFICTQFTDPSVCNTTGTGKWTEGNPFNNVQNSIYWSATSIDPDNAWALLMWDGSGSFGHKSGSDCHVWPVRQP
jgi:hypothetical protein